MRISPRAFRLLRFAALALLTLTASCRSRGGRANGPPFRGRLILFTIRDGESNRIYEIKADPNGKADLKVLAEDVEHYALSPDGESLLYTSSRLEGGLFLRAMDTGEVRRISEGREIGAPDWSPDGTRFCYADNGAHELVVSNLAGQIEVVTKAVSQHYNEVGSDESAGSYFGSIASPVWLGTNLIMFQRFKGPFPQTFQAMRAGGETFTENATSLAFLTGKPRIVDAPKRWLAAWLCPKKPIVLFREDLNSLSVIHEGGPYFVAHDFVDFESTEFRHLEFPRDYCRRCDAPLKFTQNTCRLYFVESSVPPETVEDPKENIIRFFAPDSLVERSGISLGNDRQLLDTLISPDEKTIALAFSYGPNEAISIRDLNTGAETILQDTMPEVVSSRGVHTSASNTMKLLGWLPD